MAVWGLQHYLLTVRADLSKKTEANVFHDDEVWLCLVVTVASRFSFESTTDGNRTVAVLSSVASETVLLTTEVFGAFGLPAETDRGLVMLKRVLSPLLFVTTLVRVFPL